MQRAFLNATFALSLTLSSLAAAQEGTSLVHDGSLGLTVAAGGERRDAMTATVRIDSGWRGLVEVGATLSPLWNHVEIRAAGRLTLFGPTVDLAALAGIRNSFGYEEWKTFFDLCAVVHVYPQVVAGPLVAVGAQYDFSPFAGVYAALTGQMGFGQGVRFGADVVVGFQFRTYVFDPK